MLKLHIANLCRISQRNIRLFICLLILIILSSCGEAKSPSPKNNQDQNAQSESNPYKTLISISVGTLILIALSIPLFYILTRNPKQEQKRANSNKPKNYGNYNQDNPNHHLSNEDPLSTDLTKAIRCTIKDSFKEIVGNDIEEIKRYLTQVYEEADRYKSKLNAIDVSVSTHVKQCIDSYYQPGKIDELNTHIGNIHLVDYLKALDERIKNYDELKTKNIEFEKKYQPICSFIEESKTKLTAIKTEIDNFKKSNEALTADNEAKEKKISRLEQTIYEKETESSTLKNKIDKEKEEKIRNQRQLDQTLKEFENLKNELKIIMPDYGADLAFFGEVFGDDWKQNILLTFLLLQSEANTRSDGLRATFSRLDDAIYDTYSDNPDRLESARNIIQKKLNEKILAGKYQIQWPLSGDELNERIHSAETSSGNRIKIARTAIVKDANGTLITKSKVKTEV